MEWDCMTEASEKNRKKWRFAIDRGGTFTDIIGISPDSRIYMKKMLSECDRYDDAGIEGIRLFLKCEPGSVLPGDQIAWIRMGTTVATNALLERKGAKTGLLITKGFRDLLEIGTQDRPDLFALAIKKPSLLYEMVEEVDERIDANGNPIQSLDIKSLNQSLANMREEGIESIAIVFLFSWKNNEHELIAKKYALEAGFKHVSTSHETMPLVQAVKRGRTTLVDAYLSPVVLRYSEKIKQRVGNIPVFFMSSSGSLFRTDNFSGKDAIMSGPAGGVLGAAWVADLCGDSEILGFDMGGTSTDVCRYDGRLERSLDVETAGVRFTTPMLRINTVAAGGGSILGFDGRKLTVGPESAGADPGPACYGRGGPACITDANLVLGRLHHAYFPSGFGHDYKSPIDIKASRARLEELRDSVKKHQGIDIPIEELALGYIRIANETMSRSIKELSTARGYDPRTHTLITFGGAGAQHACGIAKSLDIKTIRIPPLVSLLSAWGIMLTPHMKTRIETVLAKLDDNSLKVIHKRAMEIISGLESEIKSETVSDLDTEFIQKIELDLRIPGTDTFLTIEYSDNPLELKQKFHEAYFREYGFTIQDSDPEIVNLRIEVCEKSDEMKQVIEPFQGFMDNLKPIEKIKTWFKKDKPHNTPVYLKFNLNPEVIIKGPAIIIDPDSTIVVEPGFQASVDDNGVITLKMLTESEHESITDYDPVMLEIFHNLFMGIAEQMGQVLQRTSHSVNIKERLDFSCAVFDSEGNLVANAPHIPVHLGAMGESVKNIIKSVGDKMKRGDFYCSNDPFAGGSHLPDITVVAPVYRETKPAFYLAARGHHADIGGVTPGSMHPFAQSLGEEGVVIRNLLIARDGVFQEDRVIKTLSSGDYPARNIPERIADLKAQVAAVNKGITEINRLCDRYDDEMVIAYMRHIRDDAREAMYDALNVLMREHSEKEFRFKDYLDDGSEIHVSIKLSRDNNGKPQAIVDFTGTSPHLRTSLNAPPAVTKAAVLYVLRTLIRRPIPLNDGCLDPVKIIIPDGCLLNPSSDVAVCGGNVETSQRIVDCLLGALGVAAASQGTMNNIAFGDPDSDGSQYYETLAGGSGAVDGSDGASAVQVHMTNTRITDPEIIELRFPKVRLKQYKIRKGSGGAGKYSGGDGVTRSYEFLDSQSLTILSERRNYPPFGLNGGNHALKGENLIIHPDGKIENIGGKYQGVINAGDVLMINTPGGGGFGEPEKI
jgi:5-oxoprolinase (ATP-hydrolysing)